MSQEDYVEYSRHGNVIKGQERANVKSKYEEDVFSNNHTVSASGDADWCLVPSATIPSP